jgi:PAS domain S-box-containing protein
MRDILRNSNIVVVGGGRVCKAILKIVLGKHFPQKVNILGVADVNEQAEGLIYARRKGIFTTLDYRDLYDIEGLDLIIEVTGDNKVLEELRSTKPAQARLIDHFEAMSVWDFLQIGEERERIKRKLRKHKREPEQIEKQFDLFSRGLAKIVEERTRHLQSVEREIVKRERALSQIIGGNTIPTFVINKDHIVTHWNRAIEKLTGCKAAEMVGTDNQWCPFRPEKRPIMADVIVDELKEEEIEKYYGHSWRKSSLIEGAYEAEEFFPSIGEEGRWLFFTAAPIKDADGKRVGSIETLWDTTEQREAREELQKAHDELEQKTAELERANVELKKYDEIKSAFLANMSHELRTPLNSIIGYTDLLLDRVDGEINEEQEKSIKKVHNNARNLLNLINDVLDMSRIESGRVELDLQGVDLEEVIQDTVSALEPLIRNKGLIIETDFQEGLPWAYADPDRVRQVVTNLLDNAIKFTAEGRITIGARSCEAGAKWNEPAKFIEVCVSDTGIGIRDEDLDKLFGKFKALDASTTSEYKGVGLGLNICKGLVEMQNGRIWVKSKYGEGSRFCFTLPVTEEAIKRELYSFQQDYEAEAARPAETAVEMEVLVVDDEKDHVELIGKILRDGGYRITKAYDGEEAIVSIKHSKPDLIILDLMMPNVSGFDVIEYVRKGEDTKEIPVIVVTGKELTRDEIAMLDGTVERILRKGFFEAEEVLEEVRSALIK